MKKTETGWAIAGPHGLYIGWHFTRIQMIAQHVHDVCAPDEPDVPRFVWGGKLSADQARIWDRCKKNGDRAVKVNIQYEVRP